MRSISSSTLLAPMRKRLGCSQRSPSSSFTRQTYSSACFRGADSARGLESHGSAGFAGVIADGPRHHHAAGSVAFTVSLPVDVLMKSAPAIMATRLARATFSRFCNSPVARITFISLGVHAALNAATSS